MQIHMYFKFMFSGPLQCSGLGSADLGQRTGFAEDDLHIDLRASAELLKSHIICIIYIILYIPYTIYKYNTGYSAV